jgi:nitroreductase/dihydropteridine reductase
MGMNQSFSSSLEWRRAVKHFGTGEVDTTPIVQAMINAPSSFGLQPYKILAVSNKDLKEKLAPVSYNQPQVKECQTLFILCARTDVEARAEEYLKATEAVSRGMRDMLMGFISYLPDKTAWATKQAYIALGFGLAAAAEHKIASCPMEGFSSVEVAKILELPSNLVPVVYLAVGEATEDDGTYARFRFPESDLVIQY